MPPDRLAGLPRPKPERLPWIALSAILSLTGACSSSPRIQDHPIPFGETRQAATLAYIEAHYGERPGGISITPRIIVLHWTAIGTLDGSVAAFTPPLLAGSRPELDAAESVNVSIQFLVDRDGTVYRLMPEAWMARHVIGLNRSAIGVENVGGEESVDDLTDDQIEANSRLVRYLVKRYPTIEYLIGHLEYREFEGHRLWRERDPGYRTDKVDPGERFMTAVRRRVRGLGLKGVAEIRAEILADSR